MSEDEEERAALSLLCIEAGVLPSEMRVDPKFGLCVSLSGVRKLAAIAPDKVQAANLLRAMEDAAALSKATPAGRA